MSYTTVSKVRELSGFDDSTKISDAVVRGKIERAESIVDSAIGYRYLLPLDYHRQNTLTFGGAGTDTGTMAIVVNGTTYNVSVTNGLTSSQAADLFRDAASSSSDFITTSRGSGDEVILISKSDSDDLSTASAEVNITSAPTTQGITGTIGSRSDRYTPYVDNITAEIAAALLLMDDYGIEAQDTPKDGELRMEAIKEELARFQGVSDDNLTMRLFDEVTKVELDQATNGLPEYYPNDTSDTDTDDPTASRITMSQLTAGY